MFVIIHISCQGEYNIYTLVYFLFIFLLGINFELFRFRQFYKYLDYYILIWVLID